MDILPHTDTTSIIRVPTLQEEPKGASPLRNCTKVIMNPATKCFNPPAPPHGQTRLLKRKTTSPKWCHMAKAHVTKPRFNTQPNSSFDFHRKCNLNQPVWKFFYCCHFFFFNFWLCWVVTAMYRLFSSCGEPGLLFVVVYGLLLGMASLVAEHRLQVQASVVVTHRLSSCRSPT